jgi:hypothetical protein
MSVASFRRYHDQRREQLAALVENTPPLTNGSTIEEVVAENRTLRERNIDLQRRLDAAERVADEKWQDRVAELRGAIEARDRQLEILRARLPRRPSQAMQALIGDHVDVRDLPDPSEAQEQPTPRQPQGRRIKPTG